MATPRGSSVPTSFGRQVVGLLTLVMGIYILTITRDSPPGCAAGMRALLGRSPIVGSQYQLCEVEEKDPV